MARKPVRRLGDCDGTASPVEYENRNVPRCADCGAIVGTVTARAPRHSTRLTRVIAAQHRPGVDSAL